MKWRRISSPAIGNRRTCVGFAALLAAAAAGTTLSYRGVAHAGMTPQLRVVLRATTGDRMTARVLVYTPAPLGAYTLQVSFDPTAVAVVDLAGGSAPEFAAAPMVDRSRFESGQLRFSAFQAARMNGPRGRVHVATLTFRRLQQSGAGIDIAVEAITVADTAGTKYHARARQKRMRPRRPGEAQR